MSSTEKPKWYTIRLRILDYSNRALANIAGVCFVPIILLGIMAILITPEQRTALLSTAAFFCGLLIAALGALIYKRLFATDESGFIKHTAKLESTSTQLGVGIGITAGIAAAWFISDSAGMSSDTIAKLLGIGGLVLFGICAVIVVGMRIRGKRR